MSAAARAVENYSRALRGLPTVEQERARLALGCLFGLFRLLIVALVAYIVIRTATR